MEPKPTYETQNAALALTTTTLFDGEIAERWWLSFTPDHEPTAAAARYIEKTGYPPTYIIKTPSLLLVGPLHNRIRGETLPAAAVEPAPRAAPEPEARAAQGLLF